MKGYRRAIGIIAATLVVWGIGGCVDQEASLGIRGVVEYNGTETTEEVECGSGESVETRNKPVFSCQKSVEPGSVDEFLVRASINISNYEGMNPSGQLGPSIQSLTDDDFCKLGAAAYGNAKYGRPWFELTLDTENRLKDSREVGSEGQGGGGGGFENLNLNTNDIHLQQLKLRFPDAPAGELEKTIQLSLLAESGGGGAAVEFVLFESGDTEELRSVHQSLASSPDEAVTIVAEFTIEGETLGGNEITSNTFSFPIQLCGSGCNTTPVCNFQAESGGGGG